VKGRCVYFGCGDGAQTGRSEEESEQVKKKIEKNKGKKGKAGGSHEQDKSILNT
jgi:hypothetical protein